MSLRTTNLLRTALSTLYYSGASNMLRPLTRGRGVIFMLHSVSPAPRQDFEPNRILRITPQFLETVVRYTKDAGFDCIAIDEVPERLSRSGRRPFAVFTFDDGYRDNREYAYPILKRHDVPFTIYVPSAFADGQGELWWLNLEAAIRDLDSLTLTMDGEVRTFSCATLDEKESVHHAVYWWLRQQPEADARSVVADLVRRAGGDPAEPGRRLMMHWDELRDLAKDPHVTIGAHTVHHFALSRLNDDKARSEIIVGAHRLESELGRPCRHFSFPYGDELAAGPRDFAILKQEGFLTAVTTRKGLLHDHHADELTALPRLSINGDFQDRRYLKTLLSGAPFAIRDVLGRFLSRPAPG